jgi:hypothetical protein
VVEGRGAGEQGAEERRGRVAQGQRCEETPWLKPSWPLAPSFFQLARCFQLSHVIRPFHEAIASGLLCRATFLWVGGARDAWRSSPGGTSRSCCKPWCRAA